MVLYMIIVKDNLKNPYVLAYCKAHGVKQGEKVKNIDYMFWIDKKHDDFRKLHNLPEHIELNETENKHFLSFIGL